MDAYGACGGDTTGLCEHTTEALAALIGGSGGAYSCLCFCWRACSYHISSRSAHRQTLPDCGRVPKLRQHCLILLDLVQPQPRTHGVSLRTRPAVCSPSRAAALIWLLQPGIRVLYHDRACAGQPPPNAGPPRWLLSPEEQQDFALILDMDGNSWSSRFQLLAQHTAAPILKQASPLQSWWAGLRATACRCAWRWGWGVSVRTAGIRLCVWGRGRGRSVLLAQVAELVG